MAAVAIEIITTSQRASPAQPGDLCNLLQVAASALHLIDLQIDDELRPLIRIGLTAIRQAADAAPVRPSEATLQVARRLS